MQRKIFRILFLTLGLLAAVFLSDARRRAAASEAENKRNQEAILRLLNEMGDLAAMTLAGLKRQGARETDRRG